MAETVKLSILYSVVVSGILVLAFVIASFYVPLLELDPEKFIVNLQTNKFIISYIFDFVSLAAVALGFASLLQIMENVETELVDGLLAIARTTARTAENIKEIKAKGDAPDKKDKPKKDKKE